MHKNKPLKKHKTHFSLLALFFILLLWSSTNVSQAVLQMQRPGNEDVEDANAQVNKNEEQNNQEEAQPQETVIFKIKTYAVTTINAMWDKKELIATGVVIAGGIALAAYSYSTTATAASSVHLSPPTSSVVQTAATVVSSAPTTVVEQMTTSDASWFSATDDISASLKNLWKIASTGVSTVSQVPVPQAPTVQGLSAAPQTLEQQAPGVVSSIFSSASSAVSIIIKTITGFTPRQLGGLLCGVGGVGLLIWWKIKKSLPSKETMQDYALGWGVLGPLLSSFVSTAMSPFFILGSGPAAYLGREAFKKTEAHTTIKDSVEKICEKILPDKGTIRKLIPVRLLSPNGGTKENETFMDRFLDGYGGGTNNNGGGNDNGGNSGAAKRIGEWTADLVGRILGVAVFAVFCIIWAKFYKKDNTPTPEAAPTPKPAPRAKEQPAPKKEKTDLGDSLLLHIIHTLGLGEMAYNLVNQTIEKLEQAAEKYTQHQRYNPESKFTKFKEQVTGTLGPIAAKWPFN